MKWVIRSVVVLAVLYAGLAGAVLMAMVQPPERFGQIMKHVPGWLAWGVLPGPRMWQWARQGTLAIGDPAPGFTLSTLDHQRRVSLDSLRGRPVVLVFGSYT